jgi:cupin 2 domain-containing protein
MNNLFHDLPSRPLDDELFFDILKRPGLRLERIVSTGQSTPQGQWMDQAWDEWVLLARGRAGLTLEGEPTLAMEPGDHLTIPAGRRHRVEWTETPTVWLALHLDDAR